MPLYDFKCPECGHVFEKMCALKTVEVTRPDGKKMKETYIKDPKWPCPKCKALALRQFSPQGVDFQFNTLEWKKHHKSTYFDD